MNPQPQDREGSIALARRGDRRPGDVRRGDAQAIAIDTDAAQIDLAHRQEFGLVGETNATLNFTNIAANQAGGNAASLADLFDVCVAEGYLVLVAPDIYLHADAEAEMRQRVRDKLAGGGPGVTVAEIRDLLGTTRKYAVPFCEYLDRIGLTKREGDLRVLASALA